MTLLTISFHGTQMNSQRSLWRRSKLVSLYNTATVGKTSITEQVGCQPYIGGTFVLYDWERDQVAWQIEIDGPTGYCWHQGKLYINMLRFGEILVLDGSGRELKRISHRSFNDLHSIFATKRGFLLTSSGIDSIIEIDHNGVLLYEWNALVNSYIPPNEISRFIDFGIDHRYMIYPTPIHATHVNSARFADVDEKIILATFFSQGSIVAIHRDTSRVETLVSGLSRPHDLRSYRNDCWVVSDTGNNQTLILDKDWNIIRRIALDFNWVQSSVPLADGSIVIADANNHRLVRVDPNDRRPVEIRKYPPDWRIYLVDVVPDEYTTFFQGTL